MSDEGQAPRTVGLPDADWLRAQAHALLAFAQPALLPDGGFGLLDDRGAVASQRTELYVTCRMTHCFCIGEALRFPESRTYAAAGLEAIATRFWDDEHGGWLHAIDADGVPEGRKTAYDHAFVVLAAASAVTTGVPGAEAVLQQALGVIEEHFWDDENGLLRESFTADWAEEEDYRGVNANMHAVEAFLAAYDATGRSTWRERALRITRRVVDTWARAGSWRIPEHFDSAWTPLPAYNADTPADPFRPYGSTVGHGMEWARLCLQVWTAFGRDRDEWLLTAAQQLYDRARSDGWARDGAEGFVYTVDWDGRPVVRERMHWVAAEAIGAATALRELTGRSSYERDAATWWAYVREYVVDDVRGSWRHELAADNTPSATVWSGKPDIYHALQACVLPLVPLGPSITSACRRHWLPGDATGEATDH